MVGATSRLGWGFPTNLKVGKRDLPSAGSNCRSGPQRGRGQIAKTGDRNQNVERCTDAAGTVGHVNYLGMHDRCPAQEEQAEEQEDSRWLHYGLPFLERARFSR